MLFVQSKAHKTTTPDTITTEEKKTIKIKLFSYKSTCVTTRLSRQTIAADRNKRKKVILFNQIICKFSNFIYYNQTVDGLK